VGINCGNRCCTKNRCWLPNTLKQKNKPSGLFFVPRTGIEPAHCCQYQILSLTRLPIPPSGLLNGLQYYSTNCLLPNMPAYFTFSGSSLFFFLKCASRTDLFCLINPLLISVNLRPIWFLMPNNRSA
jgi:hypothetical protein